MLEFSQTTHQTSSSMLALVAMYQDRMIPRVHQDHKGLRYYVLWNIYKRLFVSRHAKLKEADAIVLQELFVLLRVLFQYQSSIGLRRFA